MKLSKEQLSEYQRRRRMSGFDDCPECFIKDLRIVEFKDRLQSIAYLSRQDDDGNLITEGG